VTNSHAELTRSPTIKYAQENILQQRCRRHKYAQHSQNYKTVTDTGNGNETCHLLACKRFTPRSLYKIGKIYTLQFKYNNYCL